MFLNQKISFLWSATFRMTVWRTEGIWSLCSKKNTRSLKRSFLLPHRLLLFCFPRRRNVCPDLFFSAVLILSLHLIHQRKRET